MKIKYLFSIILCLSILCIKQQTIKAQEETSIIDLTDYSSTEIINTIEKIQQRRKTSNQEQDKSQLPQKRTLIIIKNPEEKVNEYTPSTINLISKGLMNAMVSGAEGAVQAIHGYDKEILARQKQNEEERYKQKTLEYQRRQAEALEEQNHYLKYGY